MATDNFLKLDGIKGESTDDKHKEWIEVLSFNWGVSQAASARVSARGGGTSARADFQDLTITKTMDKASSLLFQFCATGEPIKEVVLELCRAGKDKHKYMEYKLSDVVITSVSVGGGGGGDPTESVSLNYAKIVQTYTQQGPDGRPVGSIDKGWDLSKNIAV